MRLPRQLLAQLGDGRLAWPRSAWCPPTFGAQPARGGGRSGRRPMLPCDGRPKARPRLQGAGPPVRADDPFLPRHARRRPRGGCPDPVRRIKPRPSRDVRSAGAGCLRLVFRRSNCLRHRWRVAQYARSPRFWQPPQPGQPARAAASAAFSRRRRRAERRAHVDVREPSRAADNARMDPDQDAAAARMPGMSTRMPGPIVLAIVSVRR